MWNKFKYVLKAKWIDGWLKMLHRIVIENKKLKYLKIMNAPRQLSNMDI